MFQPLDLGKVFESLEVGASGKTKVAIAFTIIRSAEKCWSLIIKLESRSDVGGSMIRKAWILGVAPHTLWIRSIEDVSSISK